MGPVFNRIWDTPNNGYAEKFKHAIEPFLNISKTSSIDNFDRIVKLDGIDSIVGGTTLHLRDQQPVLRQAQSRRPGGLAQAREIVERRADPDLQHQPARGAVRSRSTSRTTAGPSTRRAHFSPVALSVRAMPTNEITANMRAEFDSRYHSLRTISASGSYSWANLVQIDVGWSKRGFIKQLPGFNDPSYLDQSINASDDRAHADNRVGGIYSFNYDILHKKMLQQRISAFYNAQCCGIAFEYQRSTSARSATRRSRPTTASSCRSRSPGSGTSRRSTARSSGVPR